MSDSIIAPIGAVTPVERLRPVADLEPHWQDDSRALQAVDSTTDESPTFDSVVLNPARQGPTIASVMSAEVITIEAHRTVEELEALLKHHAISGVPVVEKGSRDLLGVVSLVDIARHHGQQTSKPDVSYHSLWIDSDATPSVATPKQGFVRDIMTPFIYFATEDSTLTEVIDLMLKHQIHRVVITRERRLVGVVTSMDLLAHFRSACQ